MVGLWKVIFNVNTRLSKCLDNTFWFQHPPLEVDRNCNPYQAKVSDLFHFDVIEFSPSKNDLSHFLWSFDHPKVAYHGRDGVSTTQMWLITRGVEFLPRKSHLSHYHHAKTTYHTATTLNVLYYTATTLKRLIWPPTTLKRPIRRATAVEWLIILFWSFYEAKVTYHMCCGVFTTKK